VDTLFDNGSQVNLISESIVKKLGLKIEPHKKPYPLGWVQKDTQLQVTRQCTLKFAISSKFTDEVVLDVVPLDICRIVLGIPYLYDRKAIFYREENKYHIFKDKVEYIVRAHKIKTNESLVSTGQIKRLVNASKSLVLLLEKQRDQDVSDVSPGCDPGHHHELVNSFGENVQKIKQFVDSFPLATMYSLLLLVSCFWLIGMTVNARDCGSREMKCLYQQYNCSFYHGWTVCCDAPGFHYPVTMGGFWTSGEAMPSLD
jgi:hypothetical protein